MQAVDNILIVVSALALSGMALVVGQAMRRGVPRAWLCALGLTVGWLALGAALLALALGAAQYDTGRFLVGMSVGLALGLSLGCAVILLVGRRAPLHQG